MKNKNIAKSAFLVTIMMLVFKIIGFIKQAIVACYYGASIDTDTYFIAWGFVTEVSEAIVKALSVSLVAVYTELLFKKNRTEASRLINGVLEVMMPVFIGLIMISVICAPAFSSLLAPTYSGTVAKQLSFYIRVLSPIFLFICFELFFGAILDSNQSFFLPRLQSIIYSIITIGFCVFFSKTMGVNALICAQYTSSILFTCLLTVAVKQYHKFFLVRLKSIPEIRSILATSIPLVIGNSAIQINQIVDKSITSGLGDGVTSALMYCQTLEQFVTNIMIVNIGNILFANFAIFVAQNELEKVATTLTRAINILIQILIGVSIITIFNARDIVSIVYFRGNFAMNAVELTAVALIGYAWSFPMVAVRDLSIKSLYAFKDTKHPMIASILSIFVNIGFSLLLSRCFGIFGVTISTSISVTVGMILNALFLKKNIPFYKFGKHIKTFIKCIPASVSLSVLCLMIRRNIENSMLKFILSTVIGSAVYFAILYLCKISEIKYIFDRTIQKIVGRNDKAK